jgi:hypothetical protein
MGGSESLAVRERDFETEAAALARRLREIFVEHESGIIAAAVVEALAPLAHERKAVIVGSYIHAGRVQRALVEADCTCFDCLEARPLQSGADDLLW